MRWMSTTPWIWTWTILTTMPTTSRTAPEVDYIFFTDLPSSSKGTLYYDYGYSSEREVEEEEEFDRDEIDEP